jgi:hypothetical protein
MAILNKFPLLVRWKTAKDQEETPVAVNMVTPNDKEAGVDSSYDHPASNNYDNPNAPSEEAQAGVQKIQAVTLAWSNKSLVAIFLLYLFVPVVHVPCPYLANIALFDSLWLLFLTNGFKNAILYSLTPYATSSFSSHSLLTVIEIVASAMAAALYIPVAKMLDVWGRAEGFLVMLGFSTLGLILMAVSKNLPTFCAAQVIIFPCLANIALGRC